MGTGEVNVEDNPEMNNSIIQVEVDFMLLKLVISLVPMGHYVRMSTSNLL